MNRRAVILLLLLVYAAPLAAETLQGGKQHRIGYLGAGSPDAFSEAFRQSLSKLGWLEAENLIIDWRWADGKNERLPELARELVGLAPEVLVTITTPATHAGVAATKAIPMVFSMVADPVGAGFVSSLARPGGNVTGLKFVPELDFFSKQLQLLTELVPGVSRVVVLSAATNQVHPAIVEATTAAGNEMGLEILSRPVRTLGEIKDAFTEVAATGPSASLVIADFMFTVHARRLADMAATLGVPVMYGAGVMVESGGLIAYAPDMIQMQRRVAAYVDKILRGTEPAEIPVERPSKFKLLVNLRAAREIGVNVPPTLLMQADNVIE